ncbi:hypothetical protein FLJC2902T_03880 [Flavobacterium limnosediminis JC2902]|uniref:Uncharacterized protein n=1 Tax=Flavobacterium limnosediminis JC2902 TaxID=1341181 RepID=V6ST71_9FLAO|nr:hypothetical protein [Flavobacterium limnosediminis]ESU29908.1 hypothetical protein FLJC2902T_03880 [Flavobacterium limnosediminis JC2902]
MKKLYTLITLLVSVFLQAQTAAVGIGTTNPQQKLHLDDSVGTLRIESLDKDNNAYNGGNLQPGGTYPLYVDSNGILTLSTQALTNSDGLDAIDHMSIPTSSITLTTDDADGKVEKTFFTYTITVPRAAVLEVKYSLSFEVYQTNSPLTMIRDGGARRITTYYTLDSATRKYGQASKCYMNQNINNPAPFLPTERIGATGQLYNSSTTYIQLTPGTHTVHFKTELSSSLPSLETYVRLAVDIDSVFMRLY